MRWTVGPGGTERVGVWIDYNHNGLFESSEFTLLGSGNGVTINGTINIPSTALPHYPHEGTCQVQYIVNRA